MFTLTLTDIAWNWFEPNMNGIQSIASLKKFLKRLNYLRQTQREQHIYWHSMRIDYNKHDVEQFTHDLKVLEKLIGMSDNQIL